MYPAPATVGWAVDKSPLADVCLRMCSVLAQGHADSGRRRLRPGQPGLEGNLEQWEMVQDSTIFSFDSIEDLKQKLQPSTHVQLSPDDVMIWQSALLLVPSRFSRSLEPASVPAPHVTSARTS